MQLTQAIMYRLIDRVVELAQETRFSPADVEFLDSGEASLTITAVLSEEDLDPEDLMPDTPTEGDWIIIDTTVFQYDYPGYPTRLDPDEDAEAWIRRQMDVEQFWPDIWTLSDHGNWHLHTERKEANV